MPIQNIFIVDINLILLTIKRVIVHGGSSNSQLKQDSKTNLRSMETANSVIKL